jgi:hypothetical protein
MLPLRAASALPTRNGRDNADRLYTHPRPIERWEGTGQLATVYQGYQGEARRRVTLPIALACGR